MSTDDLPSGYRPAPGFEARKTTTVRVWVARVVVAVAVLQSLVAVAAVALPALPLVVFGGLGLYALALYLLSSPAPELRWDRAPLTPVTALLDVDAGRASRLEDAGYQSVEALAVADSDRLTSRAVVDDALLRRLQVRAVDTVGSRERARSRLRAHAPGQGRTSEDRPR